MVDALDSGCHKGFVYFNFFFCSWDKSFWVPNAKTSRGIPTIRCRVAQTSQCVLAMNSGLATSCRERSCAPRTKHAGQKPVPAPRGLLARVEINSVSRFQTKSVGVLDSSASTLSPIVTAIRPPGVKSIWTLICKTVARVALYAATCRTLTSPSVHPVFVYRRVVPISRTAMATPRTVAKRIISTMPIIVARAETSVP